MPGEAPERPDRRGLLLLGGALVALGVGWQAFVGARVRLPEFRPIAGAPGWQFGAVGALSATGSADFVTLGLTRGPAPLEVERLEEVVHAQSGASAPRVAVFSDFFCPFCRGLIGRIAARQAAGAGWAVTWHELPMLNPSSEIAARALIAADLQGGYAALHAYFIAEGLRPAASWIESAAIAVGLDGGQLVREMDGMVVAARLQDSAAAAARLGFFATPGLVVERRAVLGALSARELEALLRDAARDT